MHVLEKSTSRARPESLQCKGAMQQVVHFLVPGKSPLPVSLGSSAVQGDLAAQLLTLTLQVLLPGQQGLNASLDLGTN